jgi:hypothetical protein
MAGRGGQGFLIGLLVVLVGIVGVLAGVTFFGGGGTGAGGEPGETTILQLDAGAMLVLAGVVLLVLAAVWAWNTFFG